MDIIHIAAIVVAVLVFLWAIYVAFRGGERYMKSYVRNMGEGHYDLKKFKKIHVPFLFLAAACFLSIGLNVKAYIPVFILLIAMFIQLYLIAKFARSRNKTI